MVISVKEITIIKDRDLGGELNPVSNNNELRKVINEKDLHNTYIYTKGTFKVDKDILFALQDRNITLVGLSFATLQQTLISEQTKIFQNSLLYGKTYYSTEDLIKELQKRRFINENVK